MRKKFPADIGATQFLQRYWQREPLITRGALPQYAAIITRERLMKLAGREELESKLVIRARGRWIVRDGPFTTRDFARLPHRGWTLLVHGVDLALASAARLASELSFIPYARFDDVMVSYAAPEGGVGPHFDSYDVFLLQAQGRRRWRVGHQANVDLVPATPLRILQRFEPDREWVVEAGDLLYLPPGWAHDGIAIDECITCSIGFRAPHAQELAERFLDYLRDRMSLAGIYEDPGSTATREPARIPSRLVDASVETLERIHWSTPDVVDFLGRYLTEPKPQVVFSRPRAALDPATFTRRAQKHGLRLALATRLLYRGSTFFINGESVPCPRSALPLIRNLANDRALAPPVTLSAEASRLMHEWYGAGYIETSD